MSPGPGVGAPPLPAQHPGPPTYCHVGGTARLPRFGFGVDQAAADAEVTKLDLASLVSRMLEGLASRWITPCFSFQVVERLHNLQCRQGEGLIGDVEAEAGAPACPLVPSRPLTATVILPRIHSGMGPCIRFLSFSAHVPMSSMAMKTSAGTAVAVPLCPPDRLWGPGEEMGGWGKPSSHVSDESPEALHNVGAVVALEHHIQIHEDPLVLLLIPRAPHLLHGTAEGLAEPGAQGGPMGHGRGLCSHGQGGVGSP